MYVYVHVDVWYWVLVKPFPPVVYVLFILGENGL